MGLEALPKLTDAELDAYGQLLRQMPNQMTVLYARWCALFEREMDDLLGAPDDQALAGRAARLRQLILEHDSIPHLLRQRAALRPKSNEF